MNLSLSAKQLSKYRYYGYLKYKSFVSSNLDRFKKGPLLNYCIEKNAGDLFNKDFIKDYYDTNARLYYGGRRKHVLLCGSILSRSNRHSIVMGVGFISPEIASIPISFYKVIGVRGNLTANALLLHNENISFEFKGDPGLMAQEVVPPRDKRYKKTGIIGIIPHFSDINIAKNIIGSNKEFLLIDIRNSYVDVCNQILSCDCVLSSSLHGLIFSDAMNVPNNWIKLSDNLIGGNYKFEDYYSVMENPKNRGHYCKSIKDIRSAQECATVSVNPNYHIMVQAVNKYFTQFS